MGVDVVQRSIKIDYGICKGNLNFNMVQLFFVFDVYDVVLYVVNIDKQNLWKKLLLVGLVFYNFLNKFCGSWVGMCGLVFRNMMVLNFVKKRQV